MQNRRMESDDGEIQVGTGYALAPSLKCTWPSQSHDQCCASFDVSHCTESRNVSGCFIGAVWVELFKHPFIAAHPHPEILGGDLCHSPMQPHGMYSLYPLGSTNKVAIAEEHCRPCYRHRRLLCAGAAWWLWVGAPKCH